MSTARPPRLYGRSSTTRSLQPWKIYGLFLQTIDVPGIGPVNASGSMVSAFWDIQNSHSTFVSQPVEGQPFCQRPGACGIQRRAALYNAQRSRPYYALSWRILRSFPGDEHDARRFLHFLAMGRLIGLQQRLGTAEDASVGPKSRRAQGQRRPVRFRDDLSGRNPVSNGTVG
jgi:hypothetical protein